MGRAVPWAAVMPHSMSKSKTKRRSSPVRPGDTLLSAVLRSGLGIPYECNAGGCGSCKITLLEGDVVEDREDAPGLSPRDRRKGKRLACVCRPQGDCRIAVRCDPAYEAKIVPKRRGVRLTSRAPLANDLWSFASRRASRPSSCRGSTRSSICPTWRDREAIPCRTSPCRRCLGVSDQANARWFGQRRLI